MELQELIPVGSEQQYCLSFLQKYWTGLKADPIISAKISRYLVWAQATQAVQFSMALVGRRKRRRGRQNVILATISGKIGKRWVRLTTGDRVKMEMSPYDLDKARIVGRLKCAPNLPSKATFPD